VPWAAVSGRVSAATDASLGAGGGGWTAGAGVAATSTGGFLAAGFLAFTGVQTFTRFFLPWTLRVTTRQCFLTAFLVAFFFLMALVGRALMERCRPAPPG